MLWVQDHGQLKLKGWQTLSHKYIKQKPSRSGYVNIKWARFQSQITTSFGGISSRVTVSRDAFPRACFPSQWPSVLPRLSGSVWSLLAQVMGPHWGLWQPGAGTAAAGTQRVLVVGYPRTLLIGLKRLYIVHWKRTSEIIWSFPPSSHCLFCISYEDPFCCNFHLYVL